MGVGPDLRRLSISQLQSITGKSPRHIAEKLRGTGIQPVATDGRSVFYDPRQALPVLYEADSPGAQKSRLDRARADAQEMKNAVSRGELVPEANVGLVGTTIIAAVGMRVMGLRTLGAAARAAGSDAEAAQIIEDGARDALTEIADMGDLARSAAGSGRAGATAADDDLLGGEAAVEADDE